jgi:thioredoxin 1
MFEITKGNFEKEVLNSKEVVLIDFWAPWCMPCKIIAPTIEKIAAEFKTGLRVGKSNIDDNPELATELSILNIPTLIFFKNGKEAARLIGINPKEAIEAKIKALLLQP